MRKGPVASFDPQNCLLEARVRLSRGGSVKLTFESLNVKDNAIPATLAMAELIDSDGNPVLVQGGALLMVVRGEGNAGQ